MPWEEKAQGCSKRWAQSVGTGPPNTVLLSPGLPLGQQPGGGGVAGEAHAGGRRHQVSHPGEHQVPEAGLRAQAHPEVSGHGAERGGQNHGLGWVLQVVETRQLLLRALQPGPSQSRGGHGLHHPDDTAHHPRAEGSGRPSPLHGGQQQPVLSRRQEGHRDTLLLRGQTSPPRPVPQPSNWSLGLLPCA